jgi:hypothetical protein
MSLTPKAIQDLLDELEASPGVAQTCLGATPGTPLGVKGHRRTGASRSREKNDRSRRPIIKEAIRKTFRERLNALGELVRAVNEYRKLADQPLILRDSAYTEAVKNLNQTIQNADHLLGP